MNRGVENETRPFAAINDVYRSIEEYWATFRPAGWPNARPEDTLYPLDALLVHRLLAVVPGRPLLVDATLETTGGSVCVLGLDHPSVRDVWAVTHSASLMHERSVSALEGYVRARNPQAARPELVGREKLPARLANEPSVFIVADARIGDGARLVENTGRWLDCRPDVVVMVLGLGRTGECPGIQSLLSLCAPGSGRRFQLVREVGEAFMSSRLGIVARRDHPYLGEALDRLGRIDAGKYRYLRLLWQTNYAALRAACLDADILRSHSTFGPIAEEIEGLKRAIREANERAAAVFPAPPEVSSPARSLANLRQRLSPTPIGRAYRLTRRVASACLARGR